jgi:hypothetical protein
LNLSTESFNTELWESGFFCLNTMFVKVIHFLNTQCFICLHDFTVSAMWACHN